MWDVTVRDNVVDTAANHGMIAYVGRAEHGATPSTLHNMQMYRNTVTNFGINGQSRSSGMSFTQSVVDGVIECNTISSGPRQPGRRGDRHRRQRGRHAAERRRSLQRHPHARQARHNRSERVRPNGNRLRQPVLSGDPRSAMLRSGSRSPLASATPTVTKRRSWYFSTTPSWSTRAPPSWTIRALRASPFFATTWS